MATVTGLTAERMLEIEAASVVDGDVVGGHLILQKHDGSQVDAGSVVGPAGPTGPPGASVVAIPGEIRLWPGAALPTLSTYGRWTWANGGDFLIADYPLAAAHIDPAWNTAYGQASPGTGRFRVPDLRGVVPAGLDAMPVGAARANRLTRADAIVLAKNTGKETHILALAEAPRHSHKSDGSGADGGVTGAGGADHTHSGSTGGASARHTHGMSQSRVSVSTGTQTIDTLVQIIGPAGSYNTGVTMNNDSPDHSHSFTTGGASAYSHAHGITPAGGGGAHENVQPTIFVPYIVKLDD